MREEWSGTLAGQPIAWIQLPAYDHREEKWQRVMIDSGHGNVITSDQLPSAEHRTSISGQISASVRAAASA